MFNDTVPIGFSGVFEDGISAFIALVWGSYALPAAIGVMVVLMVLVFFTLCLPGILHLAKMGVDVAGSTREVAMVHKVCATCCSLAQVVELFMI